MESGEKGFFFCFYRVAAAGAAGGVAATIATDFAATPSAADATYAFSGGDYGPSHGPRLLPNAPNLSHMIICSSRWDFHQEAAGRNASLPLQLRRLRRRAELLFRAALWAAFDFLQFLI